MWLLMVVVSVATTLGFLGDVWWVFDLFAHFRLHDVLALGGVVVVAALRRRGRGWAFRWTRCSTAQV